MNHAQTKERSRSIVTAAWIRALELTAPIARQPGRILSHVIAERAAEMGDAPALLSERESFSYRALHERANQYSRWALAQHIGKGECVCLLMPNRPEYLAVWLGISSIGGVVALINTNLAGFSLAHCVNIASPKHIIASANLVDRLTAVLPQLSSSPKIWVHGQGDPQWSCIDQAVDCQPKETLEAEVRQVTTEDCALYIYTSGTTGLPNAARISHGRVMQWSHWFSGMMDVRPADRLYNCLPMYHSVGGIVAPGATLVGGGSMVTREQFSATHFWDDIAQWQCTLFQYIGELCRYLLHAEPSLNDTRHNLRMACGNGLRPDVWEAFQQRFAISRIFEFYAATEGVVSLFNVEGEIGSIGRTPPYLAARFPTTLICYDTEADAPARDEQGLCVRCAPNEVGEAIGPLRDGPENVGNRFEQYVDSGSSERKILCNVFRPGDAWFRTGDLMRKDERGFYYFVDRVGETFRWKGENVSCTEVAHVIGAFSGIREAVVYGVSVPFAEGRVGMAAIVPAKELELPALRAHLVQQLPEYACPVFLRMRNEIEVTATFKYNQVKLAGEGFDPDATADVLFFYHPGLRQYVPLDRTLYRQIRSGEVRI